MLAALHNGSFMPAHPSHSSRRGTSTSTRSRFHPSPLALVAFAVLGLLVLARPVTALDRMGAAKPADTTQAEDPNMNVAKAAVLGLVEGITEFIPVSSTGHLMVAERAMNIGQTDGTKTAADSYAVVIQVGAILAVALLYRRRIGQVLQGVVGRNDEGRHLLIALAIATLPAVILGVLLNDIIKENLFGAGPVVVAWIVGGVAILVYQRLWPTTAQTEGLTTDQITYKGALIVGLAQCLAMWPGTSRSLVTLLAGLAIGLGLAAAVEFAFLLGLITLGAATLYELAGQGSTVIDAYGWAAPIVGVIVSFVSGWIAVKWMVTYLERHDLSIFGWYRIGVGVLVAGLIGAGLL